MSFVAVGVAVAAVGVGAGVYGSISSSKQAEKNRQAAAGQASRGTISSQEFPEEAIRLFQGTERPILQAALGENQALLRPFLGGFGGPPPQLPQGYGGVPAIVGEAGRQASVGTGGLNQVNSAVAGLSPDLLAALSQLVLQRGSQLQGIVPAGYGPFFAPAQRTTQGPPARQKQTPDYFGTGAALGQSVTDIGSQVYTDNY